MRLQTENSNSKKRESQQKRKKRKTVLNVGKKEQEKIMLALTMKTNMHNAHSYIDTTSQSIGETQTRQLLTHTFIFFPCSQKNVNWNECNILIKIIIIIIQLLSNFLLNVRNFYKHFIPSSTIYFIFITVIVVGIVTACRQCFYFSFFSYNEKNGFYSLIL